MPLLSKDNGKALKRESQKTCLVGCRPAAAYSDQAEESGILKTVEALYAFPRIKGFLYTDRSVTSFGNTEDIRMTQRCQLSRQRRLFYGRS